MRPRLSPGPGLSTPPQGHLSRRRVPHPSLPLCAYPSRRDYHLAAPVHHVPRRVHGPPPLRLALSSDATGGGSCCAVGHPWRPQFGAVRGPLPSLPNGPLSSGVCARAAELGG